MRIGKYIGNSVYVHREYVNYVIPKHILSEAKLKLNREYPNFKWDYVKFNKSIGTLTFTKVDDFDNNDEPSVVEQILVGETVKKLPKPTDPYIIHGKHLMVGPRYNGFNYQRLKDRFDSYQHLDKSRMGKKSWWEKNFLTK